MNDYNHKDIELAWQERWQMTPKKTLAPDAGNSYILVEFPYPSGNLHVGHWYAFAVTDMLARFHSLQGKNVLFPIGFDSFGLPAENAAIQRGLNPKEWTYSNIAYMEKQLKSMGTLFDWDRKVVTSDSEYYRWTQWLFLQFLQKGIVHHEEGHVNWCPSCKTILANEQLEAGLCERCGSVVEQKEMMQWNFAITQYADRLIDDLDALDWPDHIKESQKNWIGRSTGAFFTFKLKASDVKNDTKNSDIEMKVFTTRPDTLFGVTYVVLAPEHPLVKQMLAADTLENKDEILKYQKEANRKTDLERQSSKEKTGVCLKGVFAIHPASGDEVPVYIADYVLAQYGTGAVMAVPAHDERDFEFAQAQNLPIKHVVRAVRIDKNNPHKEGAPIVVRNNIHAIVYNPKDDTYLCLDWLKHPWQTFVVGGVEEGEDAIEGAKREVLEEAGYKNIKFMKELRHSVESYYYAAHKNENRISYTTPLLFELIDDEKEPLDETESSEHKHFWMSFADIKKKGLTCAELDLWIDALEGGADVITEKGKLINSSDEFDSLTSEEAMTAITEKYGEVATTYKLQDWSVSRQRYWGCPIPIIHCEQCGAVPVPEDQLPVELPEMKKILMREDGKSPLAHNDEWVNVACPQCDAPARRETDTLDTFVDSSWYYVRYTDAQNEKEIASQDAIKKWLPVDFYSGGSEHTTRHLLYARFVYKVMADLGIVSGNEPFLKRNNRGLILGPDGNKMSKSKGNVIDPDDVVERVGSDSLRLYLAFMGPYGEAGSYPWDPNGVVGMRRFLERVWRLKAKAVTEDYPEAVAMLHKTIKQVTADTERLKFNTAIAAMMTLLNYLEKNTCPHHVYESLLVMLSAFAPHISEELWMRSGKSTSIFIEDWPKFDESLIESDMLTLAIQINGKVRHLITVSKNVREDELQNLITDTPDVKKWIGDHAIKRFIYIPGKIVNIVV